MGTMQLLGGDFGTGSLLYSKVGWGQQPALAIDGVQLVRNLIERVELQTQEQAQQTYSVMSGLVGAAVLGPLGALLGAGSKEGQVCFVAYLRDGRKFLAVTSPAIFHEIQGAVLSGSAPDAKFDPWLGPKLLLAVLAVGVPLLVLVKGC